MLKKLILITSVLCSLLLLSNTLIKKPKPLPLIAIANYGPHASLNATIEGFQNQLKEEGFIDKETINYEISDVGFDPSLIPQMIMNLKGKNPKLILVLTTPIAQIAKGKIPHIPLIYSAITDPVEAGLLQKKDNPEKNITGSSDKQDLNAFLKFAKSLLPKAKKVGLLYSTSEANDLALVNMMKASTSKQNLSLLTVPIEQARDVQIRMQTFKNQADLIYVGTSGPIQPTLPVISAEARKMKIPVFNAQSQAVKDGLALASFGVNYETVGRNAGKLAASVLKGEKVSELMPIYPTYQDHEELINKKVAQEFGIFIPKNLESVE